MALGRTPRKLLWGALAAAFGVGALISLLGVEVIDMVKETGLLPPEEFGPARFLDRWQPVSRRIVQACVAVFIGCAAVLFPGAGPPGRVGLLVAIAGQVVLLFHGTGALVTMIGLFMVFLSAEAVRLESHPRRDDIARGLETLTGTRVSQLLRAWPELLGVPMLAGLLTALIEAAATLPSVTEWSAPIDRWRFLGLAASAGALAALRIAVELTLMLLVCRALMGRGGVLRIGLYGQLGFGLALSTASSPWAPFALVGMLLLLDWLLRLRPHKAARLLAMTLIVGLYVFARCSDVGYWAIGPVLYEVRMMWAVLVLFGAFALPMAVWTHQGLVRQLSERPPRSVSELLRALLLSVLSPVGRPRLLTAVVFVGAWCWGLGLALNPTFFDYSEVSERALSQVFFLAITSLALLVYLRLGRPLRRAGVVLTPILGVSSIAAYALLSGYGVPRMLASQHAALTQHAIQRAELWRADPDATTGEAPRLDLESRLPETPYALGDRRPPIVVILLDGARPDHLGAYGYERNTSPNVDSVARDGVVFERAWANATATSISLRNLFTGMYASRWATDPRHPPFFTGDLVAAGYDRIYVNVPGSDLNGIGPGAFVRNQPNPEEAAAATVPFPTYEEPDKVAHAVALLDQRPSDRLFMFLHFLAPHFPWDHHEEVPTWGEGLVDRYDESVAYSDHYVGVFLDALRERGLYDDAIILITADHGTGLRDHGRWGGFLPYEEQLRVPLILKLPGAKPQRVEDPVALIDVAPTLVSLFRPGEDSRYHGLSLLPTLRGERLDRRYLFHLAQFEDAYAVTDLVTDERLTWYRHEGYLTYYDLGPDPAEQTNLADARPEAARRLLSVLRGWLAAGEGVWDLPFLYLPGASERPPDASAAQNGEDPLAHRVGGPDRKHLLPEAPVLLGRR